ncbi:MAG: hemerythrin domain-containing protein [Leptospirales bacterium]|nr:hemerythrin domain-containing protein [Leptospirales bacterium]
MKRSNYYAHVHKSLRYALSRLLIQAGQTGSDTAEIAKLSQMMHEVFFFLHFHAENENTDLLPALAGLDEKSPRRDLDEHQKLDELATQLQVRLENFPLDAEDNWLWYLDLNAYVALQLEHMNREERETLPALHKHFTDEEIAAFGSRSVARANETQRSMMLGWMFQALSREESAQYLAKLQAVVPAESFTEIQKIANLAQESRLR